MANTKVQSEQIADDAVVTSHIADNVGLGGSPTTTTQSPSDNSTKIATTAYVDAAYAALVDSSPATLNTLNELAAALGDDANFSTTVTNSIATKVALSGSGQTIADSGNLTLDAAGDIILDADGGDVIFRDGGTSYITATHSSGDVVLTSNVDDKDIIFKGYDSGSLITSLTLDMSNAGTATFHSDLVAQGNLHAGDGTNISMDSSANGQLEVDGNGYQGAIALDGSAMHIYHNSAVRDLILGTNETPRLTIDGTGNVGIGQAPNMKLNILHADQDGLRFNTANDAETFIDFGDTDDNDIGRISYDHADNSMSFRTSNEEKLTITNTGKVGVGNLSPTAKLDLGTNGVTRNATYDVSANAYISTSGGAATNTAASIPLTLGRDDNASTGDEIGLTYNFDDGGWSSTAGIFARVENASNAYTALDLRTWGGGWNTGLTVDSSGKVGIGTTSPNQLLEVANSNGGATINISTDQAAGSISSKKYTNLDFSGYNNNVNARIQSWDEASSTGYGYLTFHTNSGSNTLNEAMRIDRLGNVITTGYLKAEGQILGRTRSTNRGELMINGAGENDVSEIFFGYGDGYVGNDNNFRWGISDRGYTDGRLVFYSAPKTTGAGFVEVGSFKGSDGAFKANYGIRFGSDTAAANTLDDYEEGTWNPTLSNTSNVSNLVASDAKYRKIGNLVYINLIVQADVTSSTAETHIRVTLPITAESTQYADVGHVGFYQGTGADRFGVASLFRGTQSSGNTITDIYVAANQQVGTGTTYFRCSMVYKAA